MGKKVTTFPTRSKISNFKVPYLWGGMSKISSRLSCYSDVPDSLRESFWNRAEYKVGFICPDYKGFLQLMEKYFLDTLAKALQDQDR